MRHLYLSVYLVIHLSMCLSVCQYSRFKLWREAETWDLIIRCDVHQVLSWTACLQLLMFCLFRVSGCLFTCLFIIYTCLQFPHQTKRCRFISFLLLCVFVKLSVRLKQFQVLFLCSCFDLLVLNPAGTWICISSCIFHFSHHLLTIRTEDDFKQLRVKGLAQEPEQYPRYSWCHCRILRCAVVSKASDPYRDLAAP